MLRGVHFDFNKSNIRPGDAAVLDEAASTLKANPDVDIDVNGYCDVIGGVEYNLRLSDRARIRSWITWPAPESTKAGYIRTATARPASWRPTTRPKDAHKTVASNWSPNNNRIRKSGALAIQRAPRNCAGPRQLLALSEGVADSNSRDTDEIQIMRPNFARTRVRRDQGDLKIKDSGSAH